MEQWGFQVSVLGTVTVRMSANVAPAPLSDRNREALALLVAAGPDGASVRDLVEWLDGVSDEAGVRMAMTRLRRALPPGALGRAAGGTYRLSLPTTSVDAWWLLDAASAGTQGIPESALLQLLEASEPLAQVDELAPIERLRRKLADAQRTVLRRLETERPELMGANLIELLAAHLENDPANEHLVMLMAHCLADRGERRRALNVLADARRAMADFGLPVSDDVGAFELALLDGATPVRADPSRPMLPTRLRLAARVPLIGRDEAIATIEEWLADESPPPALMIGESGSGKTRLSAHLATSCAATGIETVYLCGAMTTQGMTLAPFATLAHEAGVEFQFGTTDQEAARVEAWTALRELLMPADGRPLIIVDDCQWLDSMSLAFLEHLATTGFSAHLVLAGRRPVRLSDWELACESVAHQGGPRLDLGGLSAETIHLLLAERHPAMGRARTLGLANEVWRLSRGNPGVARVVIEHIDEDLPLVPTASDIPADAATRYLLGRLSRNAHRVGAGAAVIGAPFDIETLSDITGMSLSDVMNGFDELLQHDILVRRNRRDYEVNHVLSQAALLGAISDAESARWHERAAEHTLDDLHRRARHLVNALPLGDAATAYEATLESARGHLSSGLAAESVRAFALADTLVKRELEPSDVGLWARALDLCGAHVDATDKRRAAFDRSISMNDLAAAYAIALGGLPEAEPIGGDPDVAQMLADSRLDHLASTLQFERMRVWSRQLALLGDASATGIAEQALALASTDRERFDAVLNLRFTRGASSSPVERLAMLADREHEVAPPDDGALADLLLFSAIDSYEAGQVDRAQALIDRLTSIDAAPVVRRWHAQLFRSTLLLDRGARNEATQRRAEAHRYGARAGFREADHAYMMSEFQERLVRQTTAELASVVDAGLLDPSVNVMVRAGVARILADAGRETEGLTHAISVTRQTVDRPFTHGVAAAALVADLMASHADSELTSAVSNLLDPWEGGLIMIGAGAASLGPADRYRAHLAGPDRLDLMRSAIDCADVAGSTMWSLVCRRDLARLEPTSRLQSEIEDLAVEVDR